MFKYFFLILSGFMMCYVLNAMENPKSIQREGYYFYAKNHNGESTFNSILKTNSWSHLKDLLVLVSTSALKRGLTARDNLGQTPLDIIKSKDVVTQKEIRKLFKQTRQYEALQSCENDEHRALQAVLAGNIPPCKYHQAEVKKSGS
jgi:hypothetical protein